MISAPSKKRRVEAQLIDRAIAREAIDSPEHTARPLDLPRDFGINVTANVEIGVLAVVEFRQHRDAIRCERIDG